MRKIAVLSLFILMCGNVSAQDRCLSILNGLHEEYSFNSDQTYVENANNWIESNSFREFLSNRDYSFQFSLPLDPGIMFGGGTTNNSSSFKKLEEYRAAGNSVFTDKSQVQHFFSKITNEQVVSKWLECIRITENSVSNDIYIQASEENGIITFKINYNKANFNDPNPILLTPVSLKGGSFVEEYENLLNQNTELTQPKMLLVVIRENPREPVFLGINTNRGNATKIVPPESLEDDNSKNFEALTMATIDLEKFNMTALQNFQAELASYYLQEGVRNPNAKAYLIGNRIFYNWIVDWYLTGMKNSNDAMEIGKLNFGLRRFNANFYTTFVNAIISTRNIHGQEINRKSINLPSERLDASFSIEEQILIDILSNSPNNDYVLGIRENLKQQASIIIN